MEASPHHFPPALPHLPKIVSREEWQRARAALLIKEKEATRRPHCLSYSGRQRWRLLCHDHEKRPETGRPRAAQNRF